MELERDHTDTLVNLINDFDSRNVIVVEGARQVGKTTTISQALRRIEHQVISLNLEEDRIACARIDQTREFSEFKDLLINDYQLDLARKQVLFIDEAQESSVLGGYVRSMKERMPSTCCILTGSSMTRLFRDNQRVPVGRFSRYKVNPFSFLEFLQARGKSRLREVILEFPDKRRISEVFHSDLLKEIDQFMIVGGLPEVVIDYVGGRNYQRTRKSILLSQQDDFVRKSGLSKQHLFMNAMRGVANHLGSPAHYSHVADSTYDSKKILQSMQAWHLINEIEQKGIATSTKFHPKRYLYDIGIAQEVRNVPFPPVSLLDTLNPALRTQIGGLFENLVLLSLQDYRMDCSSVSSWKKNAKEQVEVDFVWREEGVLPIECKASLKVSSSLSALKYYMELSDVGVGVVISAAPYEVIRDGKRRIINIPIYLASPRVIAELVR